MRRRGRRSNTTHASLQRELDVIAARHPDSMVLPSAVVDAARDPGSALHQFFTWDDTAAAEKYRLDEARQLITSVKIFHEDRQITVQALHSLDFDRRSGGGYRFTNDIMEDETLKQHLLDTFMSEMAALEKRYGKLKELMPVWGAKQQVEKNLGSGKPPQPESKS